MFARNSVVPQSSQLEARREAMVTTARRSVWIVALSLCVTLLSGPPAQAEMLLSMEPQASKVTASEGVVVWSSFDPRDSQYHLTMYRGGGLERLPVAPRRMPFDVDAGRLGHAKAIAYTRCADDQLAQLHGPLPDWTTGRRCRVYTYVVGDTRERALRLPSGLRGEPALPAIWNRQLVIAYRSTFSSPVRLALIGLRTRSVRWLRTGTRGETKAGDYPRPAPTALDLRDGRVAFEWDGVTTRRCRQFENTRGGQRALASEVWLITVGRSRRLAQACDTSAVRQFAGVSLTARDVLVRPVGSTPGHEVFRLFNASGTNSRAVPSPPGVVSSARVGGNVVYVRLAEPGYVIAQGVLPAG